MQIIHCDLDAFFASVEQRDHPAWRGMPVVVGGPPKSRGVVSTCSYEARKYGIHSAMPLTRAYRLCPHAVFVSPNYHKYVQASNQVFEILYTYTPLVEAVSIDEAYLNVAGCRQTSGTPEEIGYHIRKTVADKTGLTISVGIAANKFLAKMASEMAKPDGLRVLPTDEATLMLPEMPVQVLWGIGAKTTQKLNDRGYFSVGDLLTASPLMLRQILGSNTDNLLSLAHGIDPRTVEPDYDRKSISKETTFEVDQRDQEVIEQILLELSHQVASKLRHDHLKAETVQIKLRTPDFKTITRSQHCTSSVDSAMLLYEAVRGLYRKSGLAGHPLRLCGVGCHHLRPSEEAPPGLFAAPREKLEQVVDGLQQRFSEQKIGWAAMMLFKGSYYR